MTDSLQPFDQIGLEPAVGIDKQNKIGRVLVKMGYAPPHRESLANSFGVVADNDLGARSGRDHRSVVGAIIGNDDKAVSSAKLRLDILQRWNKSQALIVGGNNDRNALLNI